MTTTTLRVSEPREILALIPYQLGFAPHESAVLVSLRGTTVGLIARVDLADLIDPRHGYDVALRLAQHAVDDGATRALLVIYTEADLASHADTSHTARARAHVERAVRRMVGEIGCWAVSRGRYVSLDCADPGCCPVDGWALDGLESTQVAAAMVLHGAQVLPERAALAAVPPAPAAARRAARRAGVRWADRAAGARTAAQLARWRADGLALWRSSTSAAADGRAAALVSDAEVPGPTTGLPPATTAGRLHAALADPHVRDAVLLTFIPGTERLADRVVEGTAGQAVAEALRVIVDPVTGRRPDEVRTGVARTVLEHTVAHAPRRAQAPALTLLAVLAWWHGDGPRAAVHVERALDLDPDHRLAILLGEALETGMPPGWVRSGLDAPVPGSDRTG